MFRNSYQHGFLSILYSCGSSPLAIWDKQVKNGYIKRVTDDEVKSLVLEIAGTNVATTFISCPQDPKKVLGIKLPFLIMIIKNMKKYFTFEITILDDKDMHRRFRISNFQSTTRVRPFCTTMPIGLSGGWNQIQFNLADFTRRAYGSNYVETTRMQIHANCRIRRIYYADRLYSEDEMPAEFKLFLPIRHRPTRENKGKIDSKKKAGDGDIVGGDRLANEPPSFFAAESERAEERHEEISGVSEVRRKSDLASRLSGSVQRKSDSTVEKSASSMKPGSKQIISQSVNIKENSEDGATEEFESSPREGNEDEEMIGDRTGDPQGMESAPEEEEGPQMAEGSAEPASADEG